MDKDYTMFLSILIRTFQLHLFPERMVSIYRCPVLLTNEYNWHRFSLCSFQRPFRFSRKLINFSNTMLMLCEKYAADFVEHETFGIYSNLLLV